ncbi:hypothetical protein [Dysgonomonas sp.]
MKKAPLLVPIIIFLFSFTQCKDVKEAAITKKLEQEAEKFNKQCPIQANAAVRIDSCKAIPPKTLKYFITMLYVNAADFNVTDFERLTKPGIVYNIQNADDLKEARENNVTFIYAYNDNKRKLIGEITVTSEDYNKPIDEMNKGDMASMSDEDINYLLQNTISGLKEHLPMQVDEYTELIDCKVLPEKTLQYIYIFKNVSVAQFDSVAFKANQVPAITGTLKNASETKEILNAGGTFLYIYKDRDERYLCQISISSKNL